MNTTTEKIEVTIAEVAKFLGWSYGKAQSIRFRQPESADYIAFIEAEAKIRKAKTEAQKTYEQFINK